MKSSDRSTLEALVCGDRDPCQANPMIDPYGSITAAIIAKPRLFVLTVAGAGTPNPRVEPRKSACFELEDRSARALRVLRASLHRFTTRARIGRLFLRVASDAGNHAPHPWHFKIEAMLQLAEALDITFVNTHSIRAWIERVEPDLPPFEPLVSGARWLQPQQRCLEAALFTAANADVPRYFTDGVRRDG